MSVIDLDAIAELTDAATIQWMCAHCGTHPESTATWCAGGCGRDHGRMERMVVFSPTFVRGVTVLVAVVRTAQEFMSDDVVDAEAVLADLRDALAPFGASGD